jgi:hypothetical protein
LFLAWNIAIGMSLLDYFRVTLLLG